MTALPETPSPNSGQTPPAAQRRRHERVEFFLVPVRREQIPVWVFKPARHAEAAGGVVLDLSERGIRVLTRSEQPLAGSCYEMRLLLGEDERVPQFGARVRRVWSQPQSALGLCSGFEFQDADSEAEQFLRHHLSLPLTRGQPRWVRCVLYEHVSAGVWQPTQTSLE
jgi:hypothetical protein